MGLVFSVLDKNQIGGLWSLIQSGVDEVKTRWPQATTWRTDDVQRALRADTARLIFVYDHGERVGYVIVRLFQEEFNRTPYVHIWLAYLYPEHRGKVHQYLPEVLEYLDREADKKWCKYYEMDSPRPGWARLLEKYHIKKHRVVYRKEI